MGVHELSNSIYFSYKIDGDDFTRAGEASSDLKSKLKKMDISPDIIRRVAIAMYEGEINMVIHANGGIIDVDVSTDEISMTLKDSGPGITDVDKAMQAGYSTASENVRSLGFGAGMGLPNMEKYSDTMKIDTVVGEGTTVYMKIKLQ